MSDRTRIRPRPLIAACLLGGALLMSLIEFGQVYLRSTLGGPRADLASTILSTLSFWLLLAALSPLPIALATRWPLHTAPRAAAIGVHLAGAVAFGLTHAFAVSVVNFVRFSPFNFASGFSKALSLAFASEFLMYGVIVGITHAIRYHAESRERERQTAALQASLADARLAGLRAQLNPHVLFNTLNAVSVLALKGDRASVIRVVGLLSDILRSCLDESRGQHASLADELRLVESYLEIQRIRFADRLSVDVEADGDALAAQIPTLVLQPIVENAITHGVANDPRPGRISIRAHRDNGMLHLSVSDSGPGFGKSPHRGRGVGLASTRERLQQLYGDGHRMSIGAATEGGASVTLVLPYQDS